MSSRLEDALGAVTHGRWARRAWRDRAVGLGQLWPVLLLPSLILFAVVALRGHTDLSISALRAGDWWTPVAYLFSSENMLADYLAGMVIGWAVWPSAGDSWRRSLAVGARIYIVFLACGLAGALAFLLFDWGGGEALRGTWPATAGLAGYLMMQKGQGSRGLRDNLLFFCTLLAMIVGFGFFDRLDIAAALAGLLCGSTLGLYAPGLLFWVLLPADELTPANADPSVVLRQNRQP